MNSPCLCLNWNTPEKIYQMTNFTLGTAKHALLLLDSLGTNNILKKQSAE